jgi:ubiquinone/menaquinone biosynthesis C-methylase UbiE
MARNIDSGVVSGFGDEWERFDQSQLSSEELKRHFDEYFSVFPWEKLPESSVGFDLGCGSGRWARLVAPKVGTLHLIDPSSAIDVARRNLSEHDNCVFHQAPVDSIPLEDESCDFGYSLGVLHHIPDTEAGMRNCVSKLRRGAPFLVYLYYRFDNRPAWFRAIWRVTETARFITSRMPYGLRYASSQLFAAGVYLPLARFARLAEKPGSRSGISPLLNIVIRASTLCERMRWTVSEPGLSRDSHVQRSKK